MLWQHTGQDTTKINWEGQLIFIQSVIANQLVNKAFNSSRRKKNKYIPVDPWAYVLADMILSQLRIGERQATYIVLLMAGTNLKHVLRIILASSTQYKWIRWASQWQS